MKPIGVVRKVDQLGRVVLPKSVRRQYQMNEGDPIEILVQGEHIYLERYRPRCVFCGTAEGVRGFKVRHICEGCLSDIGQTKEQMGFG